ncbi:hypothetical protein FZ103_08090 [Streptomonospora sp. PA3]|uniref:hypothetical protein n=1 Tax=Streptomonospora sp. PA3 TaxID=2607326 RepID=UPI0012DCA7E2|nr:hypothetical protein [Streptomonospora sp. PA3]MUL41140.1 hypothetical protein [Streptomonospora sp. PA3]
MTTNSEDDRGATTAAPEQSAAPGPDLAEPEHGPTEGEYHAHDDGAGSDEQAHGLAPAPGGIVSAETFSIIGLMLIGGLLAGVRFTEIVPSLMAQSQEGMIGGMMIAEGAVALLAVASGLVSLALADSATRPWARWAASATVAVGALLVLVSGGAYFQVPEPQPQPPMMPGG